MFLDYKVRVIANACITRHDRGESNIQKVINGYNIDEANANLIRAEIMVKRPDIKWDMEGEA